MDRVFPRLSDGEIADELEEMAEYAGSKAVRDSMRQVAKELREGNKTQERGSK